MAAPAAEQAILEALKEIADRLDVIAKRPSEPFRFEGKTPDPIPPKQQTALKDQAKVSSRLKSLETEAEYFKSAILLKKYPPVTLIDLNALRTKIKDRAQVVEL